MINKRIESFLYSKMMSFIIIFFLLLSTCYLSKIPILEYCVEWITLLLIIIVVIFYILNCEISKFALTFIIYIVLIFISSLLSKTASLVLFAKNYMEIIALVLYLDYGFKYYKQNIVKTAYYAYSILVLINFYTIIRYPYGWYSSLLFKNNWFFRYDNLHIFMYLPTLMFIVLNKYINDIKMKWIDYCLVGIITYCVFYCFSATSVVGYSIIIGYYMFRKVIDEIKLCNSKTYFIAYVLTFLGMVVLRVQRIFSFIIVKLLGKDLTFSSRTIIWDRICIYIKERLLLGYGVEDNEIIISRLGQRTFGHAHNTILDVLYNGGILALGAFIIMLILPIKQLYKYRTHKLSKIMSVILFATLITTVFEARQENIGLYMILVSCFNIGNFINKEELKNKNELKNVK